MKKGITIAASVIIAVLSFVLFYDYGKTDYPKEYYNIYLDGELLGTILSKTELEDYIDEVTNHYINTKEVTNKYYLKDSNGEIDIVVSDKINSVSQDKVSYGEDSFGQYVNIIETESDYVDKVSTPSGLQIEKVLTYRGKIDTVENIYKKIQTKKPFTIRGYQFTIKKDEEYRYIYVTSPDIFEEAVNSLIETYVGETEYANYLNNTQSKIETTGTVIENVYIDEEIAFKEKQIPTDQTIYSDARELAQFLLFGSDPKSTSYTVLEDEMINDIAIKNQISIKEFLISNPDFKNSNRLIKPGTEVKIKETNPQLSVVAEQYVVEDKVNGFKTIDRYDDTKYIGYTEVVQTGENGLERVSQRVKIVNGLSVYVEPKGKEVLKPSVDQIVVKGDKYVPNVGDLSNWTWPSESGYTITDDYGWRIHPITGVRTFHYAMDIAGTGYNSNIYAINNGTIVEAGWRDDFGYHVIIDHNNGYLSLYGHMNKFAATTAVGATVARGQVIGYVGSTGWSTGPHIHFELWQGCRFCRVNPWSIFTR